MMEDNNGGCDDNGQMANDKRAIYEHPLFPLLTMLFEKCETATQSIDASIFEGLESELHAFIQQLQSDKGQNLLSEDEETNQLMIKAIQVMRIHLLELEKVQDLCKDFCSRYITCLKGKMQSENLLRSEHGGGYDSDDSCNSNSCSGPPGAAALPPQYMPPPPPQPPQHLSYDENLASLDSHATPAFSMSLAHNNNTELMLQQQQLFPNQQLIHTQYTAGQVGPHNSITNHFNPGPRVDLDQIAASILTDNFDDDHDDASGCEEDTTTGFKVSTKSSLPKTATAVFKAWLFQHLMHPYPSEEEKLELARRTNLSVIQVNNWFINARRRILNPTSSDEKKLFNNSKRESSGKVPRTSPQTPPHP